MTIKPVKFYPESILSIKCELVGDFDEALSLLINDMKDTAKHHSAQGLAAPQIGVDSRVFVLQTGDDYKAYINPFIVEKASTTVLADEGCLSFPQVYGHVTRAEWIKVRYQDFDGSFIEDTLTGADSVAFQHELDHLEGVVFISHLGQIGKHMALKKHRKIQKRVELNIKKMQAQLDKLGKGNIVSA